jgi:hypothetical protein
MANGKKMAVNAGDFADFPASDWRDDDLSAKTILSSITELIYTAVAIVFPACASVHVAASIPDRCGECMTRCDVY